MTDMKALKAMTDSEHTYKAGIIAGYKDALGITSLNSEHVEKLNKIFETNLEKRRKQYESISTR
jgi:hypothetical protein